MKNTEFNQEVRRLTDGSSRENRFERQPPDSKSQSGVLHNKFSQTKTHHREIQEQKRLGGDSKASLRTSRSPTGRAL